MKVRATAVGYYGHKRKRPGEIFILKPYKKKIEEIDKTTKRKSFRYEVVPAKDQFSFAWMEVVDSNETVYEAKPQKQFGPSIVPPPVSAHEVGPARAAHEAPSDEEALQDEADEAAQAADSESQDDAPTGDQEVL
jgi:hypothetical protein